MSLYNRAASVVRPSVCLTLLRKSLFGSIRVNRAMPRWSRDRWRHVPRCHQKVKVVTPISLKLNISKTVWHRRLLQIDHIQHRTAYIRNDWWCHLSQMVTVQGNPRSAHISSPTGLSIIFLTCLLEQKKTTLFPLLASEPCRLLACCFFQSLTTMFFHLQYSHVT